MKPIFSILIALVFLSFSVNEVLAQKEIQAGRLIKALNSGDCTSAEVLVSSVESVNYLNKDGISLVVYGLYFSCIDVVKHLLDKGYNADIKGKDGTTAMMMAARFGRVETIKFCLKKEQILN